MKKTNISLTDHAADRQRTRFISDAQVAFAIAFGHPLYSHGKVAYCVLKADIPNWLSTDLASNYVNTIVITEAGSTVVTTYRDFTGKGFAKLKKSFGRRH